MDYVADNNFNDLYVYFSILVVKLRYFVKCRQINNGPLHLIHFREQNLTIRCVLYATKYMWSIVIGIVTAAVVRTRSTWSIQLKCTPIDSIITLMSVWRITGKIIRTTIMLITYARI